MESGRRVELSCGAHGKCESKIMLREKMCTCRRNKGANVTDYYRTRNMINQIAKRVRILGFRGKSFVGNIVIAASIALQTSNLCFLSCPTEASYLGVSDSKLKLNGLLKK